MNPALLRFLPTAFKWASGVLVTWMASDAISSYADSQTAYNQSFPVAPTPPTDLGGPEWENYLQAMRQYQDALAARSSAVGSNSAKYAGIAAVAAVAVVGYFVSKRR